MKEQIEDYIKHGEDVVTLLYYIANACREMANHSNTKVGEYNWRKTLSVITEAERRVSRSE